MPYESYDDVCYNFSLAMRIATNQKNVVVVVADDRTGTLLAWTQATRKDDACPVVSEH